MKNGIKSVLFQVASRGMRKLRNSTCFLGYFRQFLKSSPSLSYVAKGYCATSVNTSIFRKSAVLSHGGFQYIAFYDKWGHVTVGKRELSGNKWRLYVTHFAADIRDAHNGISLGIDGAGYLHLCFGMHGSKLRYARSTAPHSLKFTTFMPMDGIEEERVTYPEFHAMTNGDLLYIYRTGVSGNGNMVIKRYILNEEKWITVQSNLIDGEGERNAYWQTWVDKDDNIFISWVWRDNPDVASNHDVCFAVSRDGGATWQKTSGEVYALPITAENAEVAWVVPRGSDLINQTSMTCDEEGRPLISTYWRDKNADAPQYRVIWHDGVNWNMRPVGEKTMPFRLGGKGTKMVPVSRPLILYKGRKALFVFRDKERGGRVVMAISEDSDYNSWHFSDLTDFDVDAWEPAFDENLWKKDGKLQLFLQTAHQGDGEREAAIKHKSSPVYILQVKGKSNNLNN